MKLTRSSRNRWSMTFSVMFAVQILISSLCISTAVQAAETTAENHCYESTMHSDMSHSDMQYETNSMDSACTHCASPENFTVYTTHADYSPVTFLLAYVAIELAVSTSETSTVSFTERAQAPPRSSTTLYTTTQRILI